MSKIIFDRTEQTILDFMGAAIEAVGEIKNSAGSAYEPLISCRLEEMKRCRYEYYKSLLESAVSEKGLS